MSDWDKYNYFRLFSWDQWRILCIFTVQRERNRLDVPLLSFMRHKWQHKKQNEQKFSVGWFGFFLSLPFSVSFNAPCSSTLSSRKDDICHLSNAENFQVFYSSYLEFISIFINSVSCLHEGEDAGLCIETLCNVLDQLLFFFLLSVSH